ncbi:MAG: methyltransferase domain-containing protein [Patescibacteria group bacterium]|nr:methyltransferase domain-containing protein [Patescibacteria group bacterium]MDE2438869.1 methyltransferase domain-containing protein [Patescibacteria group bacterium]
MKLPQELEHAIEQEFTHISLKTLAHATKYLREEYRTQGNNANTDAERLTAYAAYRMPGTFAAITHVLTELQRRHPDWVPARLLDVGAGPGTALWATTKIWPSLNSITCIENSPVMIALGKHLTTHASNATIQNASWVHANMRNTTPSDSYDLVIISYALSELPEKARNQVIQNYFEHTTHSLCIIEPAKSPRGSRVIEEARAKLVRLGAHIIAPIPKSFTYTLPEGQWLHFAERVERTHLERVVKKAFRPYEDEKFSYVIASRSEGTSYAARVILPPQTNRGYITLTLCAKEGIQKIVVTKKRHPKAYRLAKKLQWGDTLDAHNPLLALITN